MITLMLALMGWEEHVIEGGTRVWVHVSGIVVYHQGRA
jgi:hypothetical protein